MFFLLFGSSAAGKTVALRALSGRVENLEIHDFDEIGIPTDADTAWRQRANEEWVRRALDYQADGTDILLGGQTPFGELLAAPSAVKLEAISACLLDCSDKTRTARLQARGNAWLDRTGGTLVDYLNWAEWMRQHASDPQWRPTSSSPTLMLRCAGSDGTDGPQRTPAGTSTVSTRQACR
jgi:hypothetical protein